MKKRSFMVLVFLSILLQGAGQSLDSLMNVLSHPEGLSNDQLAAIRLDIARSYAFAARYDEALQSLEKVAETASDSLILSKAYRVKAQVLVRLQRMKEVGLAVESANCYRPKACDLKEVAACNNLLGVVCAFTGNYGEGFKHLYRSLLIWEKTNDAEGSGTTLMNLGVNYYKFYDYAMAVKYLNLANMHPLSDQGRRSLLANLALAYSHLDSLSHALLSIKELCSGGYSLSKQDSINAFYAYGIIYQKLSSYDSARYFFERSLTLSKSSKDERFKAENSVSLATIDIRVRDFRRASQLLEDAETAASENSNEDILLRIFEQKIFLARLTGNQTEQFLAQDQYIKKKLLLYNAHLIPIAAAGKARFYEKEYQDAIRLHREILSQTAQHDDDMQMLGYMEWLIVMLSITMLILLGISFKVRMMNAARLEKAILDRCDSWKKKVAELSKLMKKSRTVMASCKSSIETAALQVQIREQSVLSIVDETRGSMNQIEKGI